MNANTPRPRTARPRPTRRRAPRWLFAAAIGLMAGACGRKATVEDCERIVERIAQLHLKGENLVPAEDLDQRVRETQQDLRSRALSECVGKRIPKRALDCLAQAETAEGAIEECL